uniref:SET domain-containing protein n=1 Tax=Odontella aurita TaxID=265563 RepID=A0A7S4HHQ5_9STRA|mmetsp:Transcript_10135/g.29973  ORF Transcript_10135/g.29973 Transcript_10135/m.29973 type:complete len:337 (+) Transcript_10135:143-1153(+)
MRRRRLALLFAFFRDIAQVPAKEDDPIAAFNALKGAINRLPGGYVHPSLGLLTPAPSGAARGIGFISESDKGDIDNGVLIKVPLSYQMTRALALDTLTPLIPPAVLRQLPLDELDDAALLVLLLAHERGVSDSKFSAYLHTLPMDDIGCGFFQSEAPRIIPPDELAHGARYASRVSNGLSKDYAAYISQDGWPIEWKEHPSSAMAWSLCVVSSRGTAANIVPGDKNSGAGTRIVPMADFANHDIKSSGFIEIVGNERMANGDIITAQEDGLDVGSFVVRAAWRNGTVKTLQKGDELTVNYNLPGYGPVDWFLSLGFVAPELLSSPSANDNSESGEL